jgi:putative DNA-invertase from lambdoid prophage Rac
MATRAAKSYRRRHRPHVSFKRRQMLRNQAVGIAQIAKDAGLTRQTVYRIKDHPAGVAAALAAWGL